MPDRMCRYAKQCAYQSSRPFNCSSALSVFKDALKEKVNLANEASKCQPANIEAIQSEVLSNDPAPQECPVPAVNARHVRIHVDGPFCSSTEDVFSYSSSLCIAGGIGVTPFAAVMAAIKYVS